MEIVFVRHGRTKLNKEGCYIGATDEELSMEGIEEIQSVKKMLYPVEFDGIYSSPLKRARQSAEIIGRNFIIDERLREINFGIFDGIDNMEVQSKYPLEYKRWTEDYINYKIPGGESFSELFDRVERFVREVSEKHKKVLVLTHGGVIRCAMSMAFGSKEHFYKFQVNHGTVNILSIDNGYRHIKLLNAYCDLKEILR